MIERLEEEYLAEYELARTASRQERLHAEQYGLPAHDEVDRIIRECQPEAPKIVVALVHRAAELGDLPLAYVAAGPLEDLLEHCRSSRSQIRGFMRTDRELRRAMGLCWSKHASEMLTAFGREEE